MNAPSGLCPARTGGGSPLVADSESRVPLYTEQFAADPHTVYAEMREQFGTLAPVWLAPNVPATLVIGYWTALRIMNDPEHFPADPSVWQRSVPADCPVLPMMQWRPNAIRTAGIEHARYRAATVDALNRVDQLHLRTVVEQTVSTLVDGFSHHGRAELLRDFAFPLVFEVIGELIGCDPDISARTATGMTAMFDTTIDAVEGSHMAVQALAELVARKHDHPGRDITSRLLAHPAGLDDEELVHQLYLLYAAATEPTANLIANTLLLMLTDERFGGDVIGGAMSTRDALAHVLFRDPPVANFCMSYPRQPQLIDGVWVPAHQPIVISLAACNNDPKVVGGNIRNNESHLGFGAGAHSCPARNPAGLIAGDAIDGILDVLPEMELAIPVDRLRWRPGPFHRALEALPVVFPPASPLPPASTR